jgi:hypothetical protein
MSGIHTLTLGCFNVLADGLSAGEFLCEGGDDASTRWQIRKTKLCNVLSSMLEDCLVVVTTENDHFFSILNEVRVRHPSVNGVWGTNASKVSTARKQKLNRHGGGSNTYERLNAAYKNGELPPGTAVSYREECGLFALPMAGVLANDAEDMYQSDDGIGIYYLADKVAMVALGVLGEEACQVIDTLGTKIVTNADSVLRATFSHNDASSTLKSFTVYGAHLKSGEDYSKEMVRCEQLRIILEDARTHSNSVVLMDSNNSVHYEATYHRHANDLLAGGDDNTAITAPSDEKQTVGKAVKTLSSLIAEYGMVDAVRPPYQQVGNECFKMRHGRGAQPSKHFQLMFDAIDKILVPRTATILPVEYDRNRFGFERYDPAHHDALLQLRTDIDERRRFEEACRSSARISGATCAVEAFGRDHMLAGLYPNPRAPSDHPPVFCRIQL